MDASHRRAQAQTPGARCARASCRQLAAILVLTMFSTRFAHAGLPAAACASTISACGCTIQTGGLYTVTANLSANQGLTSRGACIDINDTNTTLDLKNFTLSGSG